MSTTTVTQTNLFHLLQCVHALAIEVNVPGMKAVRGSGSVLQMVKQYYGVEATRKPAAILELVALIREVDPDYVPGASIKRATAKLMA